MSDETDECDCCGYVGAPTEPYRPMPAQPEWRLCEVCAGTLVGVWVSHASVHDPTKRELGKLIAWGINHIKAEVVKAATEARP